MDPGAANGRPGQVPAPDAWSGDPYPREAGDTALRSRLGWYLLVRVALVSGLLGIAALLYTPSLATIGTDSRLLLIALAFGITAISGLVLPSVRRIRRFAAAQIGVDLGLTSLAIVATGGIDSPFAMLFHLVILNTASLRLGNGIMATAAAAALAYATLLAALSGMAPGDVALARQLFTHGTVVVSFFVIGALARYLTDQITNAERMLAERQEELRRIETLQRLIANTVENGLIVTDLQGRIISANPAATEIVGRESGMLAGLPLDSLLPGATSGEVGVPAELNVGEAGGGQRAVRLKAAPFSDTFQRTIGRIYVLQDVTAVREMESRLREHERIDACARSIRPLDDAPVTSFEGLVGGSEALRRVFSLIEKVAPSDSAVLITGESGTGKELVARAIHRRSNRSEHAFVPVNCGAIPETLIESELFGHVRGAFTGAVSDRPGLFRQANGGTIFLDEVGELPLAMQVRLLRVLQDHTVTPLGGTMSHTADVRVVAATNRRLERMVAEGRFREDLYYRLNVIRIETPPLRERPEDIPLLLLHLLRTCSTRHQKTVERVSPRTMRLLMQYSYPGNIRELENIVDHAITLCEGDSLTEQDLPAHLLNSASEPPPPPVSAPPPLFAPGQNLDDQLAAYEKDILLAALDHAGGVRKRAAELLGIKYRSLRHRLSKYGLAGAGDDDLAIEQSAES